ncbi:MAG: SLC13 family permease [bacterium]|nr:SLC13 family permease [bacterium]
MLNTEIILLLILITTITVFFAFEWVRAEVVAIGTMLFLILSGIVTPHQAFAGFASDTVMMIGGLLVMGTALIQTGIVDIAGRAILDRVGDKPKLLMPVVLISVAVLSSFISNTAATAFFLPVVLGLTAKSNIPASKFLLPLSFASILTSSVTLVSTSTNIVTSEMLTKYKMPPMGMFELTPIGIIISLVGIVYVLTLGQRLMPNRSAANEQAVDFDLGDYLSDLVILPESSLVGKSLIESELTKTLEFNIIRIARDGSYILPKAKTKLAAGDVLLVEGSRENILKIKDIKGVELKADAKLTDPEIDPEDLILVEGVILPPSPFIGRTLKGLNFRERYDIIVLAINRSSPGAVIKLSETKLRAGDVLLLQGRNQDIQSLNDAGLIRLTGSVEKEKLNLRHAPIAIGIFGLTLLAATFNFLTFPVAVILGAFLMFITKCITPEEAFRRMDWQIIVLIGCMLSIGVAMEESGAGKYLASALISSVGDSNPILLLSCFFVLAVFLTQAMSNQAAAIVLIPVAVQAALQLGFNPRPFVMMIAIAASCSYLTPLEPSCLMVYGPGNYKFRDFFIVGFPLTILIYIIAIIMVPLLWQL